VLDYLPIEAAPFGVEPELGTALSTALADDPQAADSEELAHLQARLLLLRGELDAADAAFRAAERAHPAALWPVVGQAWVELNRPEPHGEAVAKRIGEQLDAIGTAAPPWQRRDAYFVRGELRLFQLDPAGALEDFRAASELAPDWELAREGMSLAQEKTAQKASGP
jgi:tetratricopeptide (TPR) repeat protein